jgi:hypothetical protein
MRSPLGTPLAAFAAARLLRLAACGTRRIEWPLKNDNAGLRSIYAQTTTDRTKRDLARHRMG